MNKEIQPLPKFRATSVRGFVSLSFVESDGTPRGDIDLKSIREDLKYKYQLSDTQARETVNVYLGDLIRYYGYNLEYRNHDRVKLNDHRRQEYLAKVAQGD